MIAGKVRLLNLLVVLALILPSGTPPPAVQAQPADVTQVHSQARWYFPAGSKGVIVKPSGPLSNRSAVTAVTAPDEMVNDSNVVYVCNRDNVGRTSDISVDSPNWSNVTPPGVGSINDCAPDPWRPKHALWVVGSSGIWKGEKLDTLTPTWTLVQSTYQITTTTSGSGGVDRIIPSPAISGTVFALYSHGGDSKTWVGRSTDDGATWSWSRVADEGSQARDFGFAISQPVDLPDTVSVWASTRRDHLYKSTDGGQSFQRVQSLPSSTFYQLHAIYSPLRENDGSILYVGGGSSSGATSFISKTVEGGMTWTTVSPVGGDSVPRGPLRQYEIAGAAGSASRLYALVQRAQDTRAENKKLYYSSDGGASWSLRYDFAVWGFDVLGLGTNAADANRLYTLADAQHCGPTNIVFLSDDGGATWRDRSGNWRSAVGCWKDAVAVWDASIRSGLTPDPVSPSHWTLVLALRPTFRWQSVPGAAAYRLSLFHYSDVEGQLGPPIDILVLGAGATTDPSRPGFHRYRLGFDLPSGTTPVQAGYVWRIEALDSAGQVLSSSLLSAFQIPSLGGTWESVQDKGLCTGYLVAGKRKTAPCNFPSDPNPYWNQYDDTIYRWSERWDLPPAIIKAIMIGETSSAIGPRRICWWDRCAVFPPDRGYGYEPYWDYVYYVARNERGVGGISMFRQPDHPPTEPFDGLGPYSFPYDRELLSGTTIYQYATGIGYPYSIPNVTRIPGCGEDDDDPCPAKAYPAQYRTAASYGLGQVVYMFWHTDLDNFAAFVRPVNPPQKVPPEELYQPELGVNFMGFVLHTKRCAAEATRRLGAQDTNYEAWGPVLLAYNGGAKRDYADTVIERAYRFTEPTSVIAGSQPAVQWESTGHDCANPFGQTAESMPATRLPRLSPGAEIELDSGAIDLRGDDTPVWLTLSALQESAFGQYKGIIRVFSDDTRATLLWSSPWIENVNPVAAFRMSSMGGDPLLLVDWASGSHAVRTYPVQWEGGGFRQVPTLDLEGQPTSGVGSDGGGVFVSNGSLVSLEHTYEAANQRRVIEWSYGPSGFQQTRTYLIEWGITSIYLPFVVRN